MKPFILAMLLSFLAGVLCAELYALLGVGQTAAAIQSLLWVPPLCLEPDARFGVELRALTNRAPGSFISG
jgi:hypothetical protein